MAKRSREDFEPEASPPDSPYRSDTAATACPKPQSTNTQDASSPKYIQLDPGSGEAAVHSINEMRCSLPPHRQTLFFATFEEYDVHYTKAHLNRCLECRRNFPTEHFLNLHIEENHDALVSVRKERGEKTYACFVEDCERKCSTPQKRRMHLIDKHMFPKNYDFYIVNDGLDNRTSMLRLGKHRRKSSAAQHWSESEGRASQRGTTGETDIAANLKEQEQDRSSTSVRDTVSMNSKPELDMDELSGAMSSLRFVPPSVRFGGRGRGRGARGGFSKS